MNFCAAFQHHSPTGCDDLLPSFRTKLSMILAKERGRHVAKQAYGSADDGRLEAGGGGREVEDEAGADGKSISPSGPP